MKTIDVDFLFKTYDALFIDAYGVLVDAQGALPGAQAFVARLVKEALPFCIVTNDGGKLIENIAARFASLGLPIGEQQILSSAGLLADHIEEKGLKGQQVAVIGPPDAHTFVARAGAHPVTADGADPARVAAIVVCDNVGDTMHQQLLAAVNLAIRRIDRGQPLKLVLCNPDIIFPSGDQFGLTSGALMLVLQGALQSRYGDDQMPPIARLGKPFAKIFEAARTRTGGSKVALLGDQLPTDVRGALDYGIDAVLVGTGLTKVRPGKALSPSPTYYLPAVGG